MPTHIYEKIKLTDKLSLTDDSTSISSDTTNSLLISSNNAAGAIKLKSGTGGITLDSTVGAGSTGSTLGGITLISKAASSWETTSASLTLKTNTSGTLTVESAGILTLDSGSSLSIGATNATGVTIGKSGITTTVNGSTAINDNIIILNSSPSASGNDGGILIQRHSTDVAAGSDNYVGLFYQESNDRFVFGSCASNPTATITTNGYSNVQMNELLLNSTLTSTSNIIINNDGLANAVSTAAFSQTSVSISGIITPLELTQAHNSKPAMSFVCKTNGTAKTGTLVTTGAGATETLSGYLKVLVTDSNGLLTTQAYYLKLLTLS